LLLGRALTVDGGSGSPAWLPTIWHRVNLFLLTIVSVGIVAMPFAAHGNHWIFLWTFLALILGAALWLFALAKAPACPGTAPAVTGNGSIVACSITSAAITALAMILVALVIMPRINVNGAKAHRPREVAASIRDALPASTQLWVDQ
jgi:hypothetical protein